MRRIKSKDERGEMGIGTLIVFISMILVSVIAAGVMMETMGGLQQQAASTGNMARKEISNGLEILAITGDRNTDSLAGDAQDSIQVIRITARLKAGSSALSISDILITVSSGDVMAELSYDSSGNTASDCTAHKYIVQSISDDDSSISSESVVDRKDMFTIVISTDSDATDLNLIPGSHLRIRIIPLTGTTVEENLYLPSVYTTRYISIL